MRSLGFKTAYTLFCAFSTSLCQSIPQDAATITVTLLPTSISIATPEATTESLPTPPSIPPESTYIPTVVTPSFLTLIILEPAPSDIPDSTTPVSSDAHVSSSATPRVSLSSTAPSSMPSATNRPTGANVVIILSAILGVFSIIAVTTTVYCYYRRKSFGGKPALTQDDEAIDNIEGMKSGSYNQQGQEVVGYRVALPAGYERIGPPPNSLTAESLDLPPPTRFQQVRWSSQNSWLPQRSGYDPVPANLNNVEVAPTIPDSSQTPSPYSLDDVPPKVPRKSSKRAVVNYPSLSEMSRFDFGFYDGRR